MSTHCNICFEKITEQLAILPCKCKATYHKDCLMNWLGLEPSCPLCRKFTPIDNYEDYKGNSRIEEMKLNNNRKIYVIYYKNYHDYYDYYLMNSICLLTTAFCCCTIS